MLHAIKKFIKSLKRKEVLATRSRSAYRSQRGYEKAINHDRFIQYKGAPIAQAMENLTGYERNKLMCERKGNLQGITVEQINSYKGRKSA